MQTTKINKIRWHCEAETIASSVFVQIKVTTSALKKQQQDSPHKGNGDGYRLLLSDMRKWGLLRESWTEELQPSCTTSICCFMWGETGWRVHEHISWYFVHTLETQQTFLQQHVWMRHPGGAALPVQPDRAAGTSRSCYQQWQGHNWKPKVIRRDDGRRNGLLPPPAKQFSFLVLVLLLPLCTKVEEMNSHWLTYPNQTDWHPWSLTDCVQSSVPFENLWNKHAKQDSFSLNADALLCLILAKAKSNNW